jgi:hypothetical protein
MTSLPPLPPWATGPFELIVHGEEHFRNGDDFDRRIALISFDNAIEVIITTYLSLHPVQRGGREYKREDVDKWLNKYHDKLNFIDCELTQRNLAWKVDRSHILWAHDHRNEQYHGGKKGTPEKQVLEIVRNAALWLFGLLFAVDKPDEYLEQALKAKTQKKIERQRLLDIAIDRKFGIIHIGDASYYASEALFAVDPDAYLSIGQELASQQQDDNLDE